MNSPLLRKRRQLATLVIAWAMTGCGGDPFKLGKTAPVRGRVTLDNVPLHTGTVTFLPDAAQGNKSPHQPAANIREDGTYALFTVGKGEAPLGWYKVQVQAYETDKDLAKRAQSPGEAGRLAKALIDAKYMDPHKTPLKVEVVDNPAAGAYDLKLSK